MRINEEAKQENPDVMVLGDDGQVEFKMELQIEEDDSKLYGMHTYTSPSHENDETRQREGSTPGSRLDLLIHLCVHACV